MSASLPTFQTTNLLIREIGFQDINDMYDYAKLPFVGPMAGWEPHLNKNETRMVIQSFHNKKKFGQIGVFSVVLKETNKMIGTIELHSYVRLHKAELGYTIHPDFWGKGYAVEASKVLIRWGFLHLQLKRIECNTFMDNPQSIRVVEKLGFEFEGIKRNGYILPDGKIKDLRMYSLTNTQYFETL